MITPTQARRMGRSRSAAKLAAARENAKVRPGQKPRGRPKLPRCPYCGGIVR